MLVFLSFLSLTFRFCQGCGTIEVAEGTAWFVVQLGPGGGPALPSRYSIQKWTTALGVCYPVQRPGLHLGVLGSPTWNIPPETSVSDISFIPHYARVTFYAALLRFKVSIKTIHIKMMIQL